MRRSVLVFLLATTVLASIVGVVEGVLLHRKDEEHRALRQSHDQRDKFCRTYRGTLEFARIAMENGRPALVDEVQLFSMPNFRALCQVSTSANELRKLNDCYVRNDLPCMLELARTLERDTPRKLRLGDDG